jgi:hypothetical protein
VCAAFAAFYFYLTWRAKFVAAEAVREYGKNVDSGLFELLVARWYALPAAAMFALAAFLHAVSPTWGRVAHVLAWLFALGAPALVVLIDMYRVGV